MVWDYCWFKWNSSFYLHKKCSLIKVFFENISISNNNIICAEAVKVWGWQTSWHNLAFTLDWSDILIGPGDLPLVCSIILGS